MSTGFWLALCVFGLPALILCVRIWLEFPTHKVCLTVIVVWLVGLFNLLHKLLIGG